MRTIQVALISAGLVSSFAIGSVNAQTVGNLGSSGGNGDAPGNTTATPTNPNQVNGVGNSGGGNTSTVGNDTNASSQSNSGISGAGSGVTQSPTLNPTQSPVQTTTSGASGNTTNVGPTTSQSGPSTSQVGNTTTGPSTATQSGTISPQITTSPSATGGQGGTGISGSDAAATGVQKTNVSTDSKAGANNAGQNVQTGATSVPVSTGAVAPQQTTSFDSHNKTVIDGGVAGSSTAGISPGGAAACGDLVVPQGSSDLRGGINIFGVAGINAGRTKPQVASDFKGIALAVQLCAEAKNGNRLLQADLNEFLLILGQGNMTAAAFRVMIAKYSAYGYTRSLEDLIKIYHENGENEKAVEIVFETLTKINAGLARTRQVFQEIQKPNPVQQQAEQQKTQTQTETNQRQQQSINIYIDGQKRQVVQH